MSRSTAFLLIIAGAALLLWLLRPVLLPFALGMAIAYGLAPLVDGLARRGLPRPAAVALTMAAFVACGLVVVAMVVPVLVEQLRALAGVLPDLAAWAAERVRGAMEHLPARPGEDPAGPLRQAGQRISGALLGQAEALIGGGLALLELLLALALAPVLAAYFLVDWPRLARLVEDAMPRDHAASLRHLLGEIDGVLRGFISGTVVIALVLAAVYGIGLTVLGVRYGLALGILAGLFSVVPYVGTVFGLVAAVGTAAGQVWPDWQLPAQAFALFIAGQLLTDYVLAPRLIGNRVGLHPLWIVFGLFAGGTLFGFLGLLIAVPVMAVIGVLVRFGYGRYKRSRLYRGDLG
ncbi:MAG: AI-2E family transporter [Thalassobaculales bacterium]